MFCHFSFAQSQRDFILHDTLPVEILSLPSQINTPFSEYNGILFPDSTFFFASLRPESESDFGNFFQPFWSAQIYVTSLTLGGYATPKPLPSSINSEKYFNCNFTFNHDKTQLYFSRCLREPQTDALHLQCDLWESRQENGRWQKAKRLNRRINLPGTTTMQPYLVEYEDCSLLYFVSDRPNGYGGLDIWYAVYKNERFNDPINLGNAVNSKGNEITPFYDANHNILYFSANHHLGIGGYDIFYCHGSFSQWETPTNMGVPFNSTENDFYFTVNQHVTKSGYFSSNRVQEGSTKNDTCCYDIFSYQWKEQELDSVVAEIPQIDTTTISEKMQQILPLTLYFHNDEPNPRSWDTTTKLNYQTTLADYLAMKEVYKTEYAKGAAESAKIAAEAAIERFFRDSVETGFRKLALFSDFLLQKLGEGKTVELTISGFASPLHRADYNLRLSARRIASLINYLRDFRNGIFRPYLDGRAPNRLVIHAEPRGKSMASKQVSDNVNDQRNSVYSIAAALERRIQITEFVER